MKKCQHQLLLGLLAVVSIGISVSTIFLYFKPKIEIGQSTTTTTRGTIENTPTSSSTTIFQTTTTSIQQYTTSTTQYSTTSTTLVTNTYTEDQTSSLIADELSQSISNITIDDIWNAINS